MMMVMMKARGGRASVGAVHLGILESALRRGDGVRMMMRMLLDSTRRGRNHPGSTAGMTRPHLTAVEGVLRTIRAAKWAWSTV